MLNVNAPPLVRVFPMRLIEVKLLVELMRKVVVDPVASVRPFVKESAPAPETPGTRSPPLAIVVAPPIEPLPPRVPALVTVTVLVPTADPLRFSASRVPVVTVVLPVKLLLAVRMVVPLPSWLRKVLPETALERMKVSLWLKLMMPFVILPLYYW